MEGLKVENVYISKIENGFLINVSGYIKKEDDKEDWKEFKTYCNTLEEIMVKLNEVYDTVK